ncbi:hypothetical protein L1277_000414 [Okibacterium sp. HSC-33S16]|uniref:hypothetical protein n=1 Tax=Okibacterium sp. HSC-33S16 TaxID=2910965 RepID=UPI00209F0203|nr:hypothetical protein [Okibacterium sp. HSC-33S16]MCP2030350.1 hypothetical protein [Okibacterium sp. HSC-33S16]
MDDYQPLWHGGAPGLVAGDLLLPPSETMVPFTRKNDAELLGPEAKITQRADRVYVTTNRQLAQVFASNWSLDGARFGFGTLYRVTVPVEDLEQDEDLPFLPGHFQCAFATVEKVWQLRVKRAPAFATQVLNATLKAHEEAVRDTGDSTESKPS